MFAGPHAKIWRAAAVVGLLATVATTACTTRPQEVTDCFGGLLAQYPLHCDFLEEAHNDGQMPIEAIYEVGEALFLFLERSQEFNEADAERLRVLARTKIAEHDAWDECRTEHGYEFDEFGCALGVLSVPAPGHWEDRVLPRMADYEDIVVRFGGAATLSTEVAAASFRRRWPIDASERVGAAAPPEFPNHEFDVSDVNTGNIPPVDCSIGSGLQQLSCRWWERHPDLDIAAVYDANDPNLYVVIKAESDQVAKVSAAKSSLISKYDHLTQENLVVAAANHDYADLWRWETILNRFAYSSGNSVGIVHAFVNVNRTYPSDEYVFLTTGPGEASHSDPGSWRPTIQLATYEPELTVEALTHLLPALEIPLDAVGIVRREGFEALLIGEPAGLTGP